MAVKEIFILGNPKLYEVSEDFIREESETILDLARDLHDTLMAFRKEHNAGRAIAGSSNRCYEKSYLYVHR